MKKLGLYGIIAGIVVALYGVGLVFYAYFNASKNFRRLGIFDSNHYMGSLFLNIFKEMWLFFFMLIIFSFLNINLGTQLIKYKIPALKIWILYYALLTIFCAVCFDVNKLFPLDLLWNATILYISINILRKQKMMIRSNLNY